jgi:hypothetical protein
MLRAGATSICAWRGGLLLRPAVGKIRGGESGEVEPGFGPASTRRSLYIAVDGGACNRDAGWWANTRSGLREKSPSTRKSGLAARCGLI